MGRDFFFFLREWLWETVEPLGIFHPRWNRILLLSSTPKTKAKAGGRILGQMSPCFLGLGQQKVKSEDKRLVGAVCDGSVKGESRGRRGLHFWVWWNTITQYLPVG